MFLPSSIVGGKRDALLDPVDESCWYPATPTDISANSEATTVGFNLGLMFTVSVPGDLKSICYYRVADTMATSGTVAIWSITEYEIEGVLTTGEVLLGEADFTGHSGTGWKVIPLDETVGLTTASAYVASIWFPSDGANVVVPLTPYTFLIGNKISQPWGFVRANASSGFFDTHRLFVHRNGMFDVGAFKRPISTFSGGNYWVDVIYNARPDPDPPIPPMVLKWPIPEGYPNEETTGPDPATVFTVVEETMTTSADYQIVENMDLRAGLLVNHNHVTVRNCKIVDHNISIYCTAGTTGTLIQDCSMDGTGRNNLNSCGVMLAGTEVTIERCNIFRIENSTSCFGHPFPTNVIVRDCFVHHLRATPGHPHYDCQQWDGGIANVEITHNTLMNENTDTSAIMLDNYGGPIDNVLIADNYLCGGGYTCYVDDRFAPDVSPITNVRYHRNLIIPGIYSYFLISSLINIPEQMGNQLLGHGGIFDAPPPGGFVEDQIVPEAFYPYAMQGSGSIINEIIDEATGGITLGLGFQVHQDGQITGINLRRPSEGTTIEVQIGLWRFTGSSIDSGTELLATRTFTNAVKRGLINYAFDTPIDVFAGDNLVVGAYQPRGADGRIHFFSHSAQYWPDTKPSQWSRMTAYSNWATPVPLNGFSGHNGLFHYGPGLTVPLSWNSNDADFGVDPVFVAPWIEP